MLHITDNTSQPDIDKKYMRRALELARLGAGHVSPNPMVGAVIVSPEGRIIGEGYHRKFGEGHAEVNAMASVSPADERLIKDSTIYVTLEPCSHYGKTPPCAEMLCRKGVKRCVVGTGDPNPKVSGRGIRMMVDAGIEVTENVLSEECRAVNERFFTAQEKQRPWILLKWAETAKGEMNGPGGEPLEISTATTKVLMHRQRTMCDAILIGTDTLLNDNPTLTARLWPGNSPRPVIFDSPRLPGHNERQKFPVFDRNPIILNPQLPLSENMKILFKEYGITSLMVEGGRKILDSFIKEGLYDCIRVERRER